MIIQNIFIIATMIFVVSSIPLRGRGGSLPPDLISYRDSQFNHEGDNSRPLKITHDEETDITSDSDNEEGKEEDVEPQKSSPQLNLLTYRSLSTDNGGYQFSFLTGDQSKNEQGEVHLQTDGEFRGYYSFLGDDNQHYKVDYVAGIHGYRANTTVIIQTQNDEDEGVERPMFQIDPNALKSLVG